MKNNARKPVIGLTGGIGAGKSEVARQLGELGCLVVNSDDLARQALGEEPIKRAIRSRWGDGVFNPMGEVDRSAIAKIVFNSPAERKHLQSLTHPWIEKRRKEVFAAADAGVVALVIDAPLLLEAGIDRECDAVIFVDAPRELRMDRVRRNRGWDNTELSRREAAQFSLDRKRERADHTVINDDDLHALRERVRHVLQQILDGARPHRPRSR